MAGAKTGMKRTAIKTFIPWLVSLFLLLGANTSPSASLEDYVKQYREPANPPWLSILPSLTEFYAQREYTPAWDRLKAQALLQAIEEAEKEGLDPRIYGVKQVRAIIENNKSESFSPREDVFFTEIFLRYALHLSQGRLDPEKFYPEWRPYKRQINLVEALNAAIATGGVAEVLSGLAPRHPAYQRMKEELMSLKKMAAQGLPMGNVREVLTAFGDLAEGEADKRAFKEALRKFQWRHGLPPTGILNRETRRALSVSLEERIEKLKINMERWRWLPDEFDSRYLFTILPDLMLYVVDDGYTIMSMKTVIGTTKQPSPIFSGQLTFIELNPTWNIPPSIVAKEIIPKVLKDPEYLQKKKIKLFRNWSEEAPEVSPKTVKWEKMDPEKFPYRMTQEPGVNPLGRIKFMFPNEFDVYLHDTTERHLFQRQRRLYSHGCIRIEKPFELALWLLKDTELGDPERLKKEVRSGKRQKINLPKPISVYIVYLTCWVDGNGVLHFRPDYYQYDTMMKQALKTLRPSSLSPEIPSP